MKTSFFIVDTSYLFMISAIEGGSKEKRKRAAAVALQYVCSKDALAVTAACGTERLRSVLQNALQNESVEVACSAVRAATSLLLRLVVPMLFLRMCCIRADEQDYHHEMARPF